jgi:hypothetical protein
MQSKEINRISSFIMSSFKNSYITYTVKVDFVEKEAFLESIATAMVEKIMNLSENLSFVRKLRIRFLMSAIKTIANCSKAAKGFNLLLDKH